MRTHLLLLFAMLLGTATAAQQIVAAEYFIGNDPGPGLGIPINISADTAVHMDVGIPTEALSIGFHSLAIRTRHTSGIWSSTSKRNFYVKGAATDESLIYHEIAAAEYFIDSDPGAGYGTPIDINSSTAVTINSNVLINLSPGFHMLAIRTQSTTGLWSITATRPFMVGHAQSGGDQLYDQIIAAEYFVDFDPGPGAGTAIAVNAATQVSIADDLPINITPGVHRLCIRSLSSAGVWSKTASRLFFVKPEGNATFYEITAAEYFIDTDPGEGLGTPIAITAGTSVIANGAVPTDGLALGDHTMSIRFKGSTNMWSAPAVDTFTIAENIPFVYTLSVGDAQCADSADGFIQLEVTSNPDAFTYSLNGQSGLPSLNQVSAGDYQLSVTNLFGETVLDTLLTVNAPDSIAIFATVTDALCAGEATGFVDAAAFGGTNPFVFDWNGANFEALAAGTYTLDVTDAHSCTASITFTVGEPDALNVDVVSTTPVTDDVNCDGAIEVVASGGTPDYSVLWNDGAGQTTFTADNLCAGTYVATVTDSHGCQTALSVELLPSLVQETSSTRVEMTAAPNPAAGDWSLVFNLQQPTLMCIEVLDASGKLIHREENVFMPSGRSQHALLQNRLAAGHYSVRVTTSETSESIHLTVLP